MISHAISRDFSPRLFRSRLQPRAQRLFTPQELLEISQQISREYAPSRVSHQSRLVLLAVSPRRLHAYWHVAKRLLNGALNRIEPEPTTLRIYAQPNNVRESSDSQDQNRYNWFDVPIHADLGQQDVLLPEAFMLNPAMHYSAALGQMDEEQLFTPFTCSNTTETPQRIPPSQRLEMSKAMVPFIMPATIVSSAVKTASSQGKDLHHE